MEEKLQAMGVPAAVIAKLRDDHFEWVTNENSRTYDYLPEVEYSLAKALLDVYRVLLTGIHLMRTGELEAHLRRLNETARLSAVEDRIARKAQNVERAALNDADLPFHLGEYDRLTSELQREGEASQLPDAASGRHALNDLLIRIRGRL